MAVQRYKRMMLAMGESAIQEDPRTNHFGDMSLCKMGHIFTGDTSA